MKYLHIRDARVIAPAQQLDNVCDLYLAEGQLRAIGEKPAGGTIESTLDAQGNWLVPGFIDLSSYLNEPGYTQRGTIASETRAAAAAGFSHVCAQPLTRPVADSPAVIQLMQDKASSAGYSRLLPLGALTQGLEGEQLANMVSLRNAGCIALSNARQPIKDSYVLRRLMEYAATYDILLFLSADDAALSNGGVMHEGPTATRLGLAGIPETAETIALAQILLLIEQTGVRAHISQISCARSVSMLREARQRGLQVSADVAIANLCYTDAQVNGYDSRYHLLPSLRSEADRQALLAAVNAGELAICSNHQPHEIVAKKAPFAESAAGMALYAPFIGLLLQRVNDGELTLNAALSALSTLPAATLGLHSGFAEGQRFNASLINPEQTDAYGRSGQVIATFVDGFKVYQQPS
ncbi:dihydroorotase [Oceanobacter sp. 4_MG-2023]|uniref:dihydroorotase n=1 Tax=Oceanobacter sp. 4_MG-2023 TaxID=3062623 RepID=UPI002734E834|nr:dihydroorotase [Oceanobacter sp. 4_MG-2023]MDP2548597.1 dihydroorotase [Oceanobacter sp. 4_MG-2023]